MQDVDIAVRTLRDSYLNITLEFTMDEDGDTLYNLRGTYWRNNPLADKMYLIAAHDLGDAVVMLAAAVESRKWTSIDWRARLYEPGTLADLQRTRNLRNLRGGAERPSEGRKESDEYPYTKE